MPTPLRDYQLRSIQEVSSAWQDGARSVVLVSPTGCHRAGQPILLKDGSIKAVEDIGPDDLLMGPDSKPRRIKQLIRSSGQMYQINPIKGEPFVVNEDHILTLVHTTSDTIIDVSLKDWLGWTPHRKTLYKLFRVGVEFSNRHELPLDPYFLGVLLGDGSILSTVNVCTPEDEILRELHRQAALFGLRVTTSDAHNTAPTYRLSQKPGNVRTNPIKKILVALGLWKKTCDNKFVPHIYKTARRQQRLEILAGLLDTDGYLSRNCYDFISKSKQLAEDIAFLSRSLGLAAYINACEKFSQNGVGGIYHRVSISGDVNMVPCRVPRRRAAPRRQLKDALRTGFTAEKLGIEPFYGFTLTGDGRYLMGDFTVTHNSGKTRIGVEATLRATRRGKKVLWLAHRRELISQASDRLLQEGLQSHGVILADAKRGDESALVQVASVDTLRARELRPSADLIIWDEAHHCAAETWRSIHESYPNARHLGMTATPQRGDGVPLGDVFERLLVGASVRELTELGHLVKCRVWAPEKRIKTGELAKAPLDAWREQTPGKQTVLYAATVAESRGFAEEFTSAGVTAASIDGTTPTEEREQTLRRFAQGEITVLCNCGVLTEGWDMPSLEVCIVARHVSHAGLWLQIVGRVLRSSPGKESAVVLDLAGNVHKHGPPDAERSYSLQRGIELIPTLERDELSGLGTGRMPLVVAEGALVPYDSLDPEIRLRVLSGLVSVALQRGYRPGWVWHRFRDQCKAELPFELYRPIKQRIEQNSPQCTHTLPKFTSVL
jgi:superfamily II DNA or RNA helicase